MGNMRGHKIKLVAAGLAGLGLASLSPQVETQSVKPIAVEKPAAVQTDPNALGTHPEDKFLWSIMQVESSGGKNVKHKTITSGIHAGQHATGRWGLMPFTAQELITRMERKGPISDDIKAVKTMDSPQLAAYIKQRPDIELMLARQLARHVLGRQGHDQVKAAYAWNQGHNLMPYEISPEAVASSDYVKRFKTFHQVNPIKLNKNIPTKTIAFSDRFKEWQAKREAQKRNKLPAASNVTQDPGPQRPKELDDVPRIKNLRQQIKSKITEAKKVNRGIT